MGPEQKDLQDVNPVHIFQSPYMPCKRTPRYSVPGIIYLLPVIETNSNLDAAVKGFG